MTNKQSVLQALELWASRPGFGFVNALTAANARVPGMRLATFDTDFEDVSGITRWEPN